MQENSQISSKYNNNKTLDKKHHKLTIWKNSRFILV